MWRRTRSIRCTRRPCRADTWGAHTTNVGFSDEIGHFEYCDAIDANGVCTDPGAGDSKVDVDDQACLDGSQFGALIPIKGCVLDDGDFDGPSYQRDWPGTFQNAVQDRRLHGTPVRITVPRSGGKPLENVAFENDLPRIERGEPGNVNPQCDGATGMHCFNPPRGAKFYPDLHADPLGRALLATAGRAADPGYQQHVRRYLRHRVRHDAAVRDLRGRRLAADHAGRGLPPRPGRQPLLIGETV